MSKIFYPDLTEPLLNAAEEIELARRIEAGVLAADVLARSAAHDEGLACLVRLGEDAWQRFWLANLRLALRIANAEANRSDAPAEDVFQEACLGLAEAIMRWDHARGIRFSTFAYPWIHQRANQAALTRGGTVDVPLHRLRRHQRQCEESRPPIVPLPVEGIEIACPAEDPTKDAAPWWFLHLTSRERELLTLRYGFGCSAHTLAETAERLDLSVGQVRRLEASTFRHVRAVLAAKAA